jgi:hypothetical protein
MGPAFAGVTKESRIVGWFRGLVGRRSRWGTLWFKADSLALSAEPELAFALAGITPIVEAVHPT